MRWYPAYDECAEGGGERREGIGSCGAEVAVADVGADCELPGRDSGERCGGCGCCCCALFATSGDGGLGMLPKPKRIGPGDGR